MAVSKKRKSKKKINKRLDSNLKLSKHDGPSVALMRKFQNDISSIGRCSIEKLIQAYDFIELKATNDIKIEEEKALKLNNNEDEALKNKLQYSNNDNDVEIIMEDTAKKLRVIRADFDNKLIKVIEKNINLFMDRTCEIAKEFTRESKECVENIIKTNATLAKINSAKIIFAHANQRNMCENIIDELNSMVSTLIQDLGMKAVQSISTRHLLVFKTFYIHLNRFKSVKIIDDVAAAFESGEEVDPRAVIALIENACENENEKIDEKLINITTNHKEKEKLYKYTELNKIAEDAGYRIDRCNGDHGIFSKVCNGKKLILVIPQGRDSGKGLQKKILKNIRRGMII